MKTRTDTARRIFYSRADKGQMRQGYARIHNAMRRELLRAEKLNDTGRKMFTKAAWAAYLEGWG